MICPKCHKELNEKKKHCNYCGTKINSTRKESEWSSFSSYNTFEKKEKGKLISDKDYTKAYIGTKQEWVRNQFSIPAAIFGPFYLIYRKLYKQAFIMIIIYITTYFYLPDNYGITIRLLLNIVMAFKINDYYYQNVINQIEMIKNSNENIDSTELLEICQKKGGTTSPQIIISIFIIYIAIIVISSLEFKMKYTQSPAQTKIQNNQITYMIPTSAEIKTKYDNYQHIVDGKCYITVTSTKTNETVEEYLASSKSYYTDYQRKNRKDKIINDIIWKNIYMEKENTIREVYVNKYENIIYEISFRHSKAKECDANIDNLLNSINIKKNN